MREQARVGNVTDDRLAANIHPELLVSPPLKTLLPSRDPLPSSRVTTASPTLITSNQSAEVRRVISSVSDVVRTAPPVTASTTVPPVKTPVALPNPTPPPAQRPYVVQVAATDKMLDAEKIMRTLRAAGYTPTTQNAIVKGKNYIRVLIPVDSESTGRTVATKILQTGLVTASPIIRPTGR
jgi:cell division septation protein DedD